MLGPVESSVGVVQPWPHFVADELVLGLPGCLLLPHHFGLIRLRLHVDDWRRFRQFRPRGHLQTSLPGSMVHLHISARARWQVGSRTPHFLFVFLNNRNSKLIATTPQQTLNKKAVVTQPHVTRNQWPRGPSASILLDHQTCPRSRADQFGATPLLGPPCFCQGHTISCGHFSGSHRLETPLWC